MILLFWGACLLLLLHGAVVKQTCFLKWSPVYGGLPYFFLYLWSLSGIDCVITYFVSLLRPYQKEHQEGDDAGGGPLKDEPTASFRQSTGWIQTQRNQLVPFLVLIIIIENDNNSNSASGQRDTIPHGHILYIH